MTEFRGMDISDFWPHQFTTDGQEVQIGEEYFTDNIKRPIYAQPMICVHCGVRYIRGKESQPTGKCPARETKKELKRITDS
jgi:hypothetical protein